MLWQSFVSTFTWIDYNLSSQPTWEQTREATSLWWGWPLFWWRSPLGVLINQVTDAALKAANVRPGLMVVERHFGVLEFHSKAQADVKYAGDAALRSLGMKLEDRIKPKILNSKIIHKVNDYHAQMINVSRLCSMLLAGQDMYYLEVVPAGYIILAANEAEKNANVTLVECRMFGAVGRLYLSGKESDVARAAGAAESAISSLTGSDSSA